MTLTTKNPIGLTYGVLFSDIGLKTEVFSPCFDVFLSYVGDSFYFVSFEAAALTASLETGVCTSTPTASPSTTATLSGLMLSMPTTSSSTTVTVSESRAADSDAFFSEPQDASAIVANAATAKSTFFMIINNKTMLFYTIPVWMRVSVHRLTL